MTHKVYVGRTRPLKDEEIVPPIRPDERLDNTGVFYTAEPKWIIANRSTAETKHAELLLMEVHLGSHVCEFAVETRDSGGFTIVCLNHPVEFALAQPSN